MDTNILKYQALDKKLKSIKSEVQNNSSQKELQDLTLTIKTAQAKILELEQISKKLLAELDKLMEVQKKGLLYVEKNSKADLNGMSAKDLQDFDNKMEQTASELAELDSRISMHNSDVKKVVLDYKMYRKKILEAKEKREKLRSEVDELTNQKTPEYAELKKSMEELEKQIEPSTLAKYKSLKQDGIFPVYVPLATNRCSGCRMELSVAALDKLKNNGVYECEQCRRMIYIEESK